MITPIASGCHGMHSLSEGKVGDFHSQLWVATEGPSIGIHPDNLINGMPNGNSDCSRCSLAGVSAPILDCRVIKSQPSFCLWKHEVFVQMLRRVNFDYLILLRSRGLVEPNRRNDRQF